MMIVQIDRKPMSQLLVSADRILEQLDSLSAALPTVAQKGNTSSLITNLR